MSREIKFRAFYRPTGEVFVPSKIDFNTKTVFGRFNEEKENWCYFSLDESYGDAILMQCTGLEDKNDVEMYEGDIVKNIGPHTPTVSLYARSDYHYINDILVVVAEPVGFRLRHSIDYSKQKAKDEVLRFSPGGHFYKPPVDNFQFWNFQQSFEVLGNVYQHPHLLEGTE